MTNQIKLKRHRPSRKTTGSMYKYKNWHIEDTGINWTARKGNESYQFKSLKDVRLFISTQNND